MRIGWHKRIIVSILFASTIGLCSLLFPTESRALAESSLQNFSIFSFQPSALYPSELTWIASNLTAAVVASPVFIAVFLFTSSPAGYRIILATWPEAPFQLNADLAPNGANDFDPLQDRSPFVGRAKELRSMREFCDADLGKHNGDKCWTVITGRMGIGKTRLGIEWLREYANKGWDTGVLKPNVELRDFQSFRIRKNTAILIDDFERLENAHSILSTILCANSHAKIRVVIVDESHIHIPDELDIAVVDILNSSRITQFGIDLAALAKSESKQITGAINVPDRMLQDGNPLLLKLGANPYGVIKQRAARMNQRALDMFGEDGPRALVLSALCGPVSDKVRRQFAPDAAHKGKLAKLFAVPNDARLNGQLPEISPSILSTEIITQYFEKYQDAEFRHLINTADEVNRIHAASKLDDLIAQSSLVGSDESQRISFETAVNIVEMRPKNWSKFTEKRVSRLHKAQHAFGIEGNIKEVKRIQNEIRKLAGTWQRDDGVNLAFAKSVHCAMTHTASEKDWQQAVEFVEMQTNLARFFRDETGQRSKEFERGAMETVHVFAIMCAAGGNYAAIHQTLDRFERYFESAIDPECVRELQCLSISNAILTFSEEKDTESVSRYLMINSRILEEYGSRKIVSNAIRGMRNAVGGLCESGRVDEARDLLESSRRLFRENLAEPTIADQHSAMLYVWVKSNPTLTSDQTKNEYLEALEIFDLYPNEENTARALIAICGARRDDPGSIKSIVSVWDRLADKRSEAAEDVFLTLANLCVGFKDPEAIDYLREAINQVRQLEVPRNPTVEIERCIARAEYAACTHFGHQQKWDEAENCLLRLKQTLQRQPSEPEIAHLLVQGIINSEKAHRHNGGDIEVAQARLWELASMARQWPHNEKIQQDINIRYPNMTYMEQQMNGWPYGLPQL